MTKIIVPRGRGGLQERLCPPYRRIGQSSSQARPLSQLGSFELILYKVNLESCLGLKKAKPLCQLGSFDEGNPIK